MLQATELNLCILKCMSLLKMKLSFDQSFQHFEHGNSPEKLHMQQNLSQNIYNYNKSLAKLCNNKQ